MSRVSLFSVFLCMAQASAVFASDKGDRVVVCAEQDPGGKQFVLRNFHRPITCQPTDRHQVPTGAPFHEVTVQHTDHRDIVLSSYRLTQYEVSQQALEDYNTAARESCQQADSGTYVHQGSFSTSSYVSNLTPTQPHYRNHPLGAAFQVTGSNPTYGYPQGYQDPYRQQVYPDLRYGGSFVVQKGPPQSPACGPTVSVQSGQPNEVWRVHQSSETRPSDPGANGNNLQSHFTLNQGPALSRCPTQCDICGVEFSNRSNMKAHREIHSGYKPYSCRECGYASVRKSDLKKHERIHTGVKPHVCEICNRAFIQSSHLKAHLRKHTGEKPYPCECGAAFRTKGQLVRHRKVHLRSRNDTTPISQRWRSGPYPTARLHAGPERGVRKRRALQQLPGSFSPAAWVRVNAPKIAEQMLGVPAPRSAVDVRLESVAEPRPVDQRLPAYLAPSSR